MEYIIEKVGMSRTISVPSVPVTLCKVLKAKVCEIGENKKAIVAYSGSKKTNKAIQGQQKKYNISKEFNKFVTLKVNNEEVGDIDLTPLKEAKRVKATFTTKGRGFSGVMKRWNFAGGPGGHGSRFHRAPGSIGNCEWPGRVQKGRKMPGQYGNTQVTVKNDVISFDEENSILVLKGAISGANGNVGKIRIIK